MTSSLLTVRLRTDDADEARERLARDSGRHSRVPVSRGPLGYELFAIGTRRVMCGTTSARLGSTVRAATVGPRIHLPLDAAGTYYVGRRKIEAAGSVGVSGRVLQKACIARWGRSPLELVAAHRMAAARTRLLSASPGTTVTQVATECGFGHLGCFATAYREAYGESPSDTIAGRPPLSGRAASRRPRAMRDGHGNSVTTDATGEVERASAV
jgi:AraC-like DNA-binding protein